jgi:hypothetical protein
MAHARRLTCECSQIADMDEAREALELGVERIRSDAG